MRGLAPSGPLRLAVLRRGWGAASPVLSFPLDLPLPLPVPRGLLLFVALAFLCAVGYGIAAVKFVPYIGLAFIGGDFTTAFLFRREDRRK